MMQGISDNSCIYYGPIRYHRRRGKAPTLLTGRRTKSEPIDGINEVEYTKRELDRQKKRYSSRLLKQKRDNIEKELNEQVKQVQQDHIRLQSQIKQLISYKQYLLNKLEEIKQDPLINLINEDHIPLFFQENNHSSISFKNTSTHELSSIEDFISIYSQ
jgi:hypothetical protein